MSKLKKKLNIDVNHSINILNIISDYLYIPSVQSIHLEYFFVSVSDDCLACAMPSFGYHIFNEFLMRHLKKHAK